MSKKIIALVLALLMATLCFALAGCKKDEEKQGTAYAKLTYTVKLNDEEYGVGFRKGSDLTAEFNKFFAGAVADGTVAAAAKAHGISEESLITDVAEGEVVEATVADLEAVKQAGKLVVGITDFKPMDYQEEGSEEWIGFDADLAKKFAESLGVTAEFIVIDWDSKIMELNGKSIDCIWNGMTITDEVKSSMSVSVPYCKNAQVIVVKEDVADQYQTAEACKDLQFAVENGSAGKDMAEEYGFNYTEVTDQAMALSEVSAGTCDAAIIDLLMADAMIG